MANRKAAVESTTETAAPESAIEILTGKVEALFVALDLANSKIAALEAAAEAKAGPKSERSMTDDDARRILATGDLEPLGHKEAAEKLNLSYGQIYSCRKGFTFKHIHKEVEKKLKELAAE